MSNPLISPLVSMRRNTLSRPLLRWFRQVLPPVSETERAALEAGTVWWDASLFSGKPDWDHFLAIAKPELSAEEQAFLDGPVEQFCARINDWKLNQQRDLSPRLWQEIKDQRLFGMIIPKEYGGLGFSALAHSSVVMKIATRSLSAAVTVMVPNSLGPAELLLHYGTERQKQYYLPRLADGREIPCFALTGPHSGSDAASMHDHGVVCYGEHNGEQVLGMRVSWQKRYITLGPVATVLGLAFKLSDPDHLLGEQEDLGITLALIPTKTPGVNIGRRHDPTRQAFMNGPNSGKDVFIPMDWIIGEREGVGRGWAMLMESLSAGRSISLPSTSTAGVKAAARFTGAYARVRRQFKLPIGKFEGIEEPLARIACNAYMLDASRQITAAAVDAGEKPSVISAILKYHSTERMRESIIDAMDIHGGKGICDGPRNYLLNAYRGLPVPITVEGANILTRSMIIFGQGAIRCHPYLRAEMEAAQNPDKKQGLIDFDRAFFGHMGFVLKNLGRTLGHNLTAGRFASAPDQASQHTAYYFRQFSRQSASFALTADIALMLLGGELKRREKLSARFGDILSELYLASCVLKRFHDDGQPAADQPLVDWNCQGALYRVQESLDDILANYPSKPIAFVLRRLVFPWGRRMHKAKDQLGHECARLLLKPSEARDRLTAGMFISRNPNDATGILEIALEKALAIKPIEQKLAKAGFSGTPEQAREAGLIDAGEAKLLQEAAAATEEVIAVDDFAPEELIPARYQDKPELHAIAS